MRNGLKMALLAAFATCFLTACGQSEATTKEPPLPPQIFKITQRTIDGKVMVEDKLVGRYYTSEHGCISYKAPGDREDSPYRYLCGGLISIQPEQ